MGGGEEIRRADHIASTGDYHDSRSTRRRLPRGPETGNSSFRRLNRGKLCPITVSALNQPANRLFSIQIIFAPRHSSCTIAEQLFALFQPRLRVPVDEGRWKFCSQLSRSAPRLVVSFGARERGGCLTMLFTHFAVSRIFVNMSVNRHVFVVLVLGSVFIDRVPRHDLAAKTRCQ
jgi:hypothetical protein